MAWDNPADYEYCVRHTPGQWAWEFIRRNPEYQQEWEKQWKEWNEGNLRRPALPRARTAPGAPDFFADPKSTDFALLPPQSGENLYGNRWWLTFYFHPEVTHPAHLEFNSWEFCILPFDTSEFTPELSEKLCFHFKKHAFPVLFDPRFPLPVQLQKAEIALKTQQREYTERRLTILQKQSPLPAAETMIDYIRVLDSIGAGVRCKVSAPVLFPKKGHKKEPEERYADVSRKAKAWMKTKYPSLIVEAIQQKI